MKNTKLLKITAVMCLVSTAFIATSCKKSETETLKDAQICINKAAPAQVQSCVSGLAQDTSAMANQLKCAAYFIEEGFGSPAALINAIDQADSGGGCGGCSESINILTELAFSSTTQAASAASVCNNSDVAIYSQLSSMVQISTLAAAAGSIASPTDLATSLNSVNAADLGNVVLSAYQASCSGEVTSGDALQQYCQELSTTVNGASAAEVGACLQEKLTGTNNPACTLF